MAAACRIGAEMGRRCRMMMVIDRRNRASGPLVARPWPVARVRSPLRPRVACRTSPRRRRRLRQPAAPTIPVVRPKVQTVSETLEVTGNAAAGQSRSSSSRASRAISTRSISRTARWSRRTTCSSPSSRTSTRRSCSRRRRSFERSRRRCSTRRPRSVRYTALLKQACGDAGRRRSLGLRAGERRRRTSWRRRRRSRSPSSIWTIPRSGRRSTARWASISIDPGNVVGGDGQDSRAGRDHPARSDLCGGQYQLAAGVADPRQPRSAPAHARPSCTRCRSRSALADETGFPHHGTIEYVAPQIDPATGTLLGPRHHAQSRPDAAARPVRQDPPADGQGRAERAAGAGPRDAGGSGRPLSDGRRHRTTSSRQRYVQLGEPVGNLRVITSGLKPDDRVVVGELWRVSPGMKVVPQADDHRRGQ